MKVREREPRRSSRRGLRLGREVCGEESASSEPTLGGLADEARRPTLRDGAGDRIKQAAGDLTDNDDLKREGKQDETADKVRDVVGDAKDKLDDAVESVNEKLS